MHWPLLSLVYRGWQYRTSHPAGSLSSTPPHSTLLPQRFLNVLPQPCPPWLISSHTTPRGGSTCPQPCILPVIATRACGLDPSMYTSCFGKPLALSQICCHRELPWSLPDPLRLTALGSPSCSLLSFRVILVSKMAFAFFFLVSHSSHSISVISKRRKKRHPYFFLQF